MTYWIGHVPNAISILRALAAAFPIPVLFLTGNEKWGLLLATLAFFSDFLDGWVARRWSAQTEFGAFFDPVADKMLCWVLLLLCIHEGGYGWEYLLPAVIIFLYDAGAICLSYCGRKGPTTLIAKWKTATLMVSLGLLLATQPIWDVWWVVNTLTWLEKQGVGVGLLWLASLLTLWSGYVYWTHVNPLRFSQTSVR